MYVKSKYEAQLATTTTSASAFLGIQKILIVMVPCSKYGGILWRKWKMDALLQVGQWGRWMLLWVSRAVEISRWWLGMESCLEGEVVVIPIFLNLIPAKLFLPAHVIFIRVN